MLTPGYGAKSILRGLQFLIANPRPLLPWMILPIALNMGAVLVAFFAAFFFVPAYVESWWPIPANPYVAYAWTVLTYALALLIFAVLVMLIYFVSGAFGSPFYDRLSEEVEHIVRGHLPAERPWWNNAFWSILHSGLGAVLWLAVLISGAIMNAAPGIGAALEVAWTLAGSAFLIARELMDGPLTRRRLTFIEKLQFVRRHIRVLGPFGITATLMLWVPLLNFIVMPVAVIGGTLLFLDIEEQTGDPPRKPEATPPELVDTVPPPAPRTHAP